MEDVETGEWGGNWGEGLRGEDVKGDCGWDVK